MEPEFAAARTEVRATGGGVRVWSGVKSRIRSLAERESVEREMDEELRFHVERYAEDLLRRGVGREEAMRRARVEFGGVEKLKEECREASGWQWMEELAQDIRYGLRMLRKNPGFTAVAVLTLALGVGANTAIFSVVYAVLLKPLPYAHAEQLFNVFQEQAQDSSAKTGWSYLNFEELRTGNGVFSAMAGAQQHQLTLTGHGEPAVINTSVVTPEFFSLFGEKPIAGRLFFDEDGKSGAPPVVILGENLWRGLFGADEKIIGSAINLDKVAFTVVGVVPAKFRFPQMTESQQLWIPLVHDPLFGSWMARRGGHWLQVTGRLKPGVSVTRANAELEAISRRLTAEFPAENSGWMSRMIPLQQMIVGNVKTALLLMLGAVGLVLLMACANIANLLLTRATSRTREMAVRTAMGAGRGRIVRQLLSENLVLGILGGGAGIILAYAGVRALTAFMPASLPMGNEARVDAVVLGFGLLLSAVASCAFGLAPALFAAKANVNESLREGDGRSGESGGRRRARSVLAAAEVALAMVLLVVAGLLLRSFSKLLAVDPGFAVQNMVKAEVYLPRTQYATPERWSAFSSELLTRIQAEPGMKNAAVAVPLPLADGFVNLGFEIEGTPPKTAAESRTANYVAVSPEYFQVMGIPLLAGRFIDAHDVMASARVSVISKTLARTYFANQDPIGKRLLFGFPPDGGEAREIVGVVGDVRDVALEQEPRAMMYAPFAQAPLPGAVMIVKSSLSASSVAAAIRRDVQAMDKDLPVTEIAQMADVLRRSVAQPKFRTFLLGLFAAMALVLAATGIFGVISYSVSRRTREIGVRMALGASRREILGMILQETLLLAATGLAVGIPCALGAARLLGHLLFGVSAGDPATLVAVGSALAGVALLAGYLPARRAMRVDPMVALRYE